MSSRRTETAALFTTGGSQAVRLPKKYRFEGDRVEIRREGNAVILEPMKKRDWPAGYWNQLRELGPIGDDFGSAEPLAPSVYRERVIDAYVRGDDLPEPPAE